MAILFILALLLAWPTFGLSLVAWFIFMFLNAKGKADKSIQREVVSEVLSPVFGGRYAEFYNALDVPYFANAEPSRDQAQQCGRHIANYIAHNPSEAALFIKGLKLWTVKGSTAYCDPVEAAECEISHNAIGHIHLVSWRAIEALMSQNNLACFRGVNLGALKAELNSFENRGALAAG